VIGPEAEVDGSRALEGSLDEQAADDEQHQRHGDLRDDSARPEAARARAGTLVRPPVLSSVFTSVRRAYIAGASPEIDSGDAGDREGDAQHVASRSRNRPAAGILERRLPMACHGRRRHRREAIPHPRCHASRGRRFP
jgi:hypothetical protein